MDRLISPSAAALAAVDVVEAVVWVDDLYFVSGMTNCNTTRGRGEDNDSSGTLLKLVVPGLP